MLIFFIVSDVFNTNFNFSHEVKYICNVIKVVLFNLLFMFIYVLVFRCRIVKFNPDAL